ncbi:hypothetical protein [Thiothrix eikelboomii]|uniref:hypothetical protein n=1 Tax=Thiothrix eikelboomii TaxID=92487 RepID=UPI003BB06FD0
MQAAFSTGVFTPPLSLIPTQSGLVVLQQHYPVAWLFSGICQTRRKTDRFVDVAYIKPTTSPMGNPNGFMLDTETFNTQEQALAFVLTLVQSSVNEGVQV